MSAVPAHLTADRSRGEHDERALVVRLRAGETSALDDILQRHWGPVMAYLVRLVGSRDAAEDVAQRTFCHLWERRASWHVSGSLAALIYRIARNFAISEHRRRGAEERSALVLAERMTAAPSPLELMEGEQLAAALSRAIDLLPERRREVFVLRCVHELSYREIGEVMGTSTQTVANQFSHALAALRRMLAPVLD
jgi:RNA polymerase sigma-70 factor (ECF subfamily)